METLDTIIEHFENKANNIVYKHSLAATNASANTPCHVAMYQTSLQKLEQDLDAEINNILANHYNTKKADLEAIITSLYYQKEKAKFEFSKKNKY